VIFYEGKPSKEHQEEVLSGRLRVTSKVGYSQSCPSGQQGGIIGITQCTRPYFLGIPVGQESCHDIPLASNCH